MKVLLTGLLLAGMAAGFGVHVAQEQAAHDARVTREAIETAIRVGAIARRLTAIDKECEATRERLAAVKQTRTHREQARRTMPVVVTAYDLGYESCGKWPSHPQYGRTATGRDLRGQTRESARAIAVDPAVIPLGSTVRLEFVDSEMKRYNGEYVACDTGGAIKGNRVDLFMGERNRREALQLGRRRATATVVG